MRARQPVSPPDAADTYLQYRNFHIPADQVYLIIEQMCAGLSHVATMASVIVRDVKLDNTLVLDDGQRIAIADFGNAVVARRGTCIDPTVVGWPNNLAWECRSGSYTFASDVFALGCVCAGR